MKPVRDSKSMGRTAPRRLSLWGHSVFADAAPSEPRAAGNRIHRDPCRFWLQTVKLSKQRTSRRGLPPAAPLVLKHSARSGESVSGGPESGPPSASLALAPAEPQFRCRASRPPSDPHATPSSLGLRPPNASDSRARERKTQCTGGET